MQVKGIDDPSKWKDIIFMDWKTQYINNANSPQIDV